MSTPTPAPGQATRTLDYEWAPMRVYVVWHPKFEPGPELAEAVYQWFGGTDSELHRSGLGIPVHPWTSTSDDEPPGPISLDEMREETVVVLLLLDAEFMGRLAWRNWLAPYRQVAKDPRGPIRVHPWAVHSSALRDAAVSEINLLGTERCEREVLVRRLTEACALAAGPGDSGTLRVFLSYARRDGAKIAHELRSELNEYGHLNVFMDEHDIQPGSRWKDELEKATEASGAMIAVVTDAYASRPWCRQELRDFRKPIRESGTPGRYWLRPVLAINAMAGQTTRSMVEIGSILTARWDPANVRMLADLIVRDTLLTAVHRMRSRSIVPLAGEAVINWVPDTWTTLELLRADRNTSRVTYPGDGLPRVEHERLTGAFPQVEFRTYAQSSVDPGSTEQRNREDDPHADAILCSASEPGPAELQSLGLSLSHFENALIRIGRALLADKLDIVYGGMPSTGLTGSLRDDSGTVVLEPRVRVVVGWPHTRLVTPTKIADELGSVTFTLVPAGHAERHRTPGPAEVARAARHTRRAIMTTRLTDMNGVERAPPLAVIAMGGRLSGFKGFMPGILEEVVEAIEAGVPVFLLGGFGGAAGGIATFLSTGDWPRTLTPECYRADAQYRDLEAACAAALSPDGPAEAHLRARETIEAARGDACALLRNRLSPAENATLFTTLDMKRAIEIVRRGISLLGPGAQTDGSDSLVPADCVRSTPSRRKTFT